jgi:hypothetical protein
MRQSSSCLEIQPRRHASISFGFDNSKISIRDEERKIWATSARKDYIPRLLISDCTTSCVLGNLDWCVDVAREFEVRKLSHGSMPQHNYANLHTKATFSRKNIESSPSFLQRAQCPNAQPFESALFLSTPPLEVAQSSYKEGQTWRKRGEGYIYTPPAQVRLQNVICFRKFQLDVLMSR